MAAPPNSPERPPGPAVDAFGRAVRDPTENVLALSEAANRRQDDLREYSEKYFEAKTAHIKETGEANFLHRQELAAAESRRVDEQATLRAHYSALLSDAEAKRIDAIRAVDVAAVGVASQRASDQASVLATQVSASAEALRTLVATTATTVATSLQQMSTTLSTRLTTLEQASYQSAGKQQFADPAFAELLSEVKQLREANRQVTGKSEGINAVWLALLGAASLVSVGVAIVALVTRPQAPISVPQNGYAPYQVSPSSAPVPPQVSVVPVVPIPAR